MSIRKANPGLKRNCCPQMLAMLAVGAFAADEGVDVLVPDCHCVVENWTRFRGLRFEPVAAEQHIDHENTCLVDETGRTGYLRQTDYQSQMFLHKCLVAEIYFGHTVVAATVVAVAVAVAVSVSVLFLRAQH